MERKKYNSKDVLRLRIRISLLIVLIVLILGFIFSPKVEVKVEAKPPEEDTVYFYPYEPEELENIVEIQEGEVEKMINEAEYKEKEEIKERNPLEEDIPFDNGKNPDVGFGIPVFIPHDVKPQPLNLDEVEFEYPKSMRILGVSGKVYLQLFVDKQGNVRNVVLMDSLHPALDKVAVENAWKIKMVHIQNNILTVVQDSELIEKKRYVSMIPGVCKELCKYHNVSNQLKEIRILNTSQKQGWSLLEPNKCDQIIQFPLHQVDNFILGKSADILIFESN